MATTLPIWDTSELERLTNFSPEVALREAVPLLASLARDPAFVAAHILPLLEGTKEVKDWYVAYRYDDKDSSCSLQVFAWPPKTRTQIHDHTTWGAYCCVVGSILEERYERLDDGLRRGYAHLRKVWQLSWSREDGVSTVLPYEKGIHRVGNPAAKTAVSVHLYGPRRAEVDGHDYDPLRDYVCDRFEA